MVKKLVNKNLNEAKANKKDEFYTQLADVEVELRNYKEHFKGKIVYCNCDDPRVSNFFHYFSYNFEHLGLKKLIATCYKSQNMDLFSQNESEQAISLEYTGDKNGNNVPDLHEIGIKPLKGDGDFRSAECIELLKEADIVVTNPPFSLFREYVAQLVKYNKKFLIIGAQNAIIYTDIFPLIKDDKLWLGLTMNSSNRWFQVPDEYVNYHKEENGNKFAFVAGVVWYTNLNHSKRNEAIDLYKKYNTEDYPTYDNYDAIEVSKVKEIPRDYKGVMGVPISFLHKFNPEQFEIVGCNRGIGQDVNGVYGRSSFLNGKETFKRLFIKNKKI
jgi:hypothetical protein